MASVDNNGFISVFVTAPKLILCASMLPCKHLLGIIWRESVAEASTQWAEVRFSPFEGLIHQSEKAITIGRTLCTVETKVADWLIV